MLPLLGCHFPCLVNTNFCNELHKECAEPHLHPLEGIATKCQAISPCSSPGSEQCPTAFEELHGAAEAPGVS